MKTHTPYIGPRDNDIWQTDFFPAEDVYDDPVSVYGFVEMNAVEEAALAGHLTV